MDSNENIGSQGAEDLVAPETSEAQEKLSDQEKLDQFRKTFEKQGHGIVPDEVIAILDQIDFRKIPEFTKEFSGNSLGSFQVAEFSTSPQMEGRNDVEGKFLATHNLRKSVWYNPAYHGYSEPSAQVSNLGIEEHDDRINQIWTRYVDYKREKEVWSHREGTIHAIYPDQLAKVGFKIEKIQKKSSSRKNRF